MKVVLHCTLYALLIGLCLGAGVITAQIENPTYAVLSLEQYRAYYSFYMLGDQLSRFADLGVWAAALVGLNFLLSTSRSLGLAKYLRYSEKEESFSWPWRALAFCSTFVLGVMWQAGLLLIVGCDLINRPLSWYHYLLISGLTLIPLLGLFRLNKEVEEHRILRWPLTCLLLTGAFLSVQSSHILHQLHGREFLVVPLLSTHYGPWGILGWVVSLSVCLGLACGVALLGITPREGAEPDSLEPMERTNFALSIGLTIILAGGLMSLYPLYFVPRYQIGLDLTRVLELRPGEVAGRTVVFLDKHDAPHTLPESESFSTPANLDRLQEWMVTAPTPSALTRPAGKILADSALWNWRPHDALDWLEVHRRRLRFSNLNRVFVETLQTVKPDPTISHHLDALTNSERFAWPGPGSRLEISQLLKRYGREEEAEQWISSAQPLGADLLQAPPNPPVPGSVQAQLTLDGEPLAGVRVALFRGQDQEELLTRTRRHVQTERSLLEQSWSPTYYQYLDYQKLLNFYGTGATDAEGRISFDGVEPGLYRLAVRLENPAELTTEAPLLKLSEGQDLDAGLYELTTHLKVFSPPPEI